MHPRVFALLTLLGIACLPTYARAQAQIQQIENFRATKLSGDGMTLIGATDAFGAKWTRSSGTQGLTYIPTDLSDDGSTIVGVDDIGERIFQRGQEISTIDDFGSLTGAFLSGDGTSLIQTGIAAAPGSSIWT